MKLRERLEEDMGMNLQDHKQFIGEEMVIILQQMDSPSHIFDFLYLGSEWNASNFDELQKNGCDFQLSFFSLLLYFPLLNCVIFQSKCIIFLLYYK